MRADEHCNKTGWQSLQYVRRNRMRPLPLSSQEYASVAVATFNLRSEPLHMGGTPRLLPRIVAPEPQHQRGDLLALALQILFAAPRARERSRMASCRSSGTQTAVSSAATTWRGSPHRAGSSSRGRRVSSGPTTRPPCMRLCLAEPGNPRCYIEGESPHFGEEAIQSSGHG